MLKHSYEVLKSRLNLDRSDKRPTDQWIYYEKFLKKPDYEEQKKRMEAAKDYFKDASEDGDANALITAQLEAMVAGENKEVFQALKNLEVSEGPAEDETLVVDENLDQD